MKIRCPIPECGHENDAEVIRCPACGAYVQPYHRLMLLPDHLFNLGIAAAQENDLVMGERYLEATLAFSPRDVEAMLALAEVQALRGHAAGALVTLDQAAQLAANNPALMERVQHVRAVVQQATSTEGAVHSQIAAAQAKSPASKNKHKHKKR